MEPIRPMHLKLIVLMLISGMLLVSVVVFGVTGGFAGEDLPVWVTFGLPILVVGCTTLVSWRWTRPSPIPADDPAPRDTAVSRLTQHLATSFAILEVPVIAGIILSFMLDAGGWPILIAAVPTLASVGFSLWPSRTNLERFTTALESAGAQTGLREAFAR